MHITVLNITFSNGKEMHLNKSSLEVSLRNKSIKNYGWRLQTVLIDQDDIKKHHGDAVILLFFIGVVNEYTFIAWKCLC